MIFMAKNENMSSSQRPTEFPTTELSVFTSEIEFPVINYVRCTDDSLGTMYGNETKTTFMRLLRGLPEVQ